MKTQANAAAEALCKPGLNMDSRQRLTASGASRDTRQSRQSQQRARRIALATAELRSTRSGPCGQQFGEELERRTSTLYLHIQPAVVSREARAAKYIHPFPGLYRTSNAF